MCTVLFWVVGIIHVRSRLSSNVIITRINVINIITIQYHMRWRGIKGAFVTTIITITITFANI